jgi:hypothetical protein
MASWFPGDDRRAPSSALTGYDRRLSDRSDSRSVAVLCKPRAERGPPPRRAITRANSQPLNRQPHQVTPVLQLAAWALAALFIAGFTGIVRPDPIRACRTGALTGLPLRERGGPVARRAGTGRPGRRCAAGPAGRRRSEPSSPATARVARRGRRNVCRSDAATKANHAPRTNPSASPNASPSASPNVNLTPAASPPASPPARPPARTPARPPARPSARPQRLRHRLRRAPVRRPQVDQPQPVTPLS